MPAGRDGLQNLLEREARGCCSYCRIAIDWVWDNQPVPSDFVVQLLAPCEIHRYDVDALIAMVEQEISLALSRVGPTLPVANVGGQPSSTSW